VTGGWRRLHNEELCNFYASQNIIRVIKSRWMKWTGYEERMWDMRNSYKISAGKPEGKGPLRRSRHRWEYESRCGLDPSRS